MAFEEIDRAARKLQRPRGLWIAFAVFLVVYTLAMFAGVAYLIGQLGGGDGFTDRLTNYESPRRVLTIRPDRTSPSTLEQGMLVVRGYRCVRGSGTVVVQQYITYRAISEGAKTVTDPPTGSPPPTVPRQSGCFEEDILLVVPPAVTPGFYYIEAAERVPSTGELRSWYSEQFEVVAR